MPRSFCAAIATTAKASLISNRSTSPTLQPTLSSSLRIAGIGAVVNHGGSWLWVAWPLISARIGRPSRSASDRRARIQRSGAVGIRRRGGRRDGAVGAEGRLQSRDLRGIDLQRMLVIVDDARTGLSGDGDRRDLGLEGAALDRLAGAGQRLDRIGVLVGAGELIGLSGGLAEIAHRAAGLVGVFKAVHHHVIDDAVVADAIAAARLGQQIGRVGHALHAAGDARSRRSRR